LVGAFEGRRNAGFGPRMSLCGNDPWPTAFPLP
jgi:hypothetical protein